MVRISCRVFSDGSALELIQGPNCELKFLHWDGGSAKTAEQFVRGDETFVPLRVDPAVLRAMRLPGNIARYGSTRKLFSEISGLISWATQAGDGVVLPLTFFVFATWLADCLPRSAVRLDRYATHDNRGAPGTAVGVALSPCLCHKRHRDREISLVSDGFAAHTANRDFPPFAPHTEYVTRIDSARRVRCSWR